MAEPTRTRLARRLAADNYRAFAPGKSQSTTGMPDESPDNLPPDEAWVENEVNVDFQTTGGNNWYSAVDAILDELLEPGEASHAAFESMDKPTCHGDPKARAWDVLQGYRAILTAIKAGK